MIDAVTGQTFRADAAGFPSGASVGVQIRDEDATVIVARTTAGVIEIAPGSGLYATDSLVAPAPGSYLVVFDDGQRFADEPLTVTAAPTGGEVIAALGYRPTVQDVADLIRERTSDTNSDEVGTFTPNTRPTNEGVERIITDTLPDTYDIVGADPSTAVSIGARRLAALSAAMQTELTYFGSQVAAGRSPYKELKELYNERLAALKELLTTAGEDDLPGNDDDGPMPEFSFPPPTECRARGGWEW